MTWYFWVWGVVSTIGGLGLILLGAVAAYELWDRVKGRNSALRDENQELKRKLTAARGRVDYLTAELKETRKGKNEFGNISP